MKVAYLLGSLNRGGTETLILDLLRNLKNQSIEAFLVYRKGGFLEDDFKAACTKHIKLSVKQPLKYIIGLRKYILQNNIQIIHAHQFIDAFLAYFACVGMKSRIVLTLHGYDYNFSLKNKLLLGYILKRTDLNIFVSKQQQEYYLHKYKLNSIYQEVIYNGISFEKFNVTSSQLNLKKELNLEPNTLLLGMVGNFVPVRDHFTVCKFLNLLKLNNVDFHFVFVGAQSPTHPELYEDCIRFCKTNNLSDCVSFLGSRPDVPEILHELDAFVYSTDHDTFGIAVIEAIYAGLPVFVNNWPVMLEVTENGAIASIYKTKDENDLYMKFRVFLENKEDYRANAKNNALNVYNKFNIKNNIDSLNKIYKRLTLS